jgi:hypothetical protein
MAIPTLCFILYALCFIENALCFTEKQVQTKIPQPPLHPKKLSVPLQAILGYKPSGLSKKK